MVTTILHETRSQAEAQLIPSLIRAPAKSRDLTYLRSPLRNAWSLYNLQSDPKFSLPSNIGTAMWYDVQMRFHSD